MIEIKRVPAARAMIAPCRSAREGYSRFCPNAPYIEQLRSRSLRF